MTGVRAALPVPGKATMPTVPPCEPRCGVSLLGVTSPYHGGVAPARNVREYWYPVYAALRRKDSRADAET